LLAEASGEEVERLEVVEHLIAVLDGRVQDVEEPHCGEQVECDAEAHGGAFSGGVMECVLEGV
jgi:hypothetical protein